jgi:CRISPR-associated protein Cas1
MPNAMPSAPFTLQQVIGAAERLRQRQHERADASERHTPHVDWLPLVESAYHRLTQRPFSALPIPAFVHDDGRKQRVLTSPQPIDRLIEETLLPRLHRALDKLLLPCAHAYRVGRSTFSAAAEASRALAAGQHAIALLDVSDFFGSIDRERLAAMLAAHLGEHELEVALSLVSAPVILAGEVTLSPRGIPLGRAISPMLANFYLSDLDVAMASFDGTYLRYADDVFLAARTNDERDAAEARVAQALGRLGLQLRAEKAERLGYDGTPFLYLGMAVDEHGVYERVGDKRLGRILSRRAAAPIADGVADTGTTAFELAAEQPNRRSQTLYVTEPGLYLRVDAGRVQVRRGQETVRELPLHRVDRILILSGVSMSSGFVSACIAQEVPVLFFVGRGRAFGSLVASGMPNPLRLRAQYDLLARAERRLDLARAVIDAKLEAMLRRLRYAPAAAEARARVAETRGRLAHTFDLTELRGHEGMATRAWYEGLALRIKPPGFAFKSRSKRPPRDPINSLLSFAYSLVFAEMQTALLAEGLDPHPALLHDLRPNHPALASDLVEPYRVLIADTFVLWMVNTGQIKVDEFERQATGAVYLAGPARKVFLAAYEGFMDRRLAGAQGTLTPRRLIHAGARAMLRVVLGDCDDLALPLGAVTAMDDVLPEDSTGGPP